MKPLDKPTLLKYMRVAGFGHICDLGYQHGREMVASRREDGELKWYVMEAEGVPFTRLFKGSIKTMKDSA